jgi:chromosome segregation ATPase
MATRDIKTRFRLEGESEYRRAIKESADAIKVLNSEQKLAKAQFEATGDAQQYLADTARILSEEIEEQEKAVAAAQAAIDKLRESGVEPTNATFQKWQEKLNNSQTALINLNKKLDDTKTAMKAQDSVIEGYKGKMSEAETSVQGLNDKLKETESEYQQHGDKQQYAADKAAILKDKIAEQEAAVNTAKEAIEHLTQEGVAENSKEMLAWKDKLAQAEEALSSTKDELSALETGMNNSNTSIETYKTNVENSKTAISNLDAQMKLAKTQFELTGDKQQYAADKAKILKEKLEEQQQAITDTQSVINLLTAQGLEPSAAEMVEWKTKLADAKLELQNTQTELDNLDTDLAENKDSIDAGTGSAKDFGDELNRVGSGIDFQNTITSIDNIKGKIEGVIKASAQAIKALWDMGTDAGKWADDLATAAASAGMDVETYQSWQYASKFIDTDVSKITGSITKLEKELGSENTEIAKDFNQLGVRTREAGGKVRDATDVFWDVIDSLHRIEDPTKRSIQAQKLLGSSWKELNPLIEAGSQAYKDLAKEGLDTAVVSEENVKKLGDMNDAQNKLNSSIEKAKFDTLAALAPTFTEVSNALNTAVGALNEFLQSKEGQEALTKMNEALSGVIKSFLGEDGGKGTFQSIVEGASGAIETFNKLLEWISQNGETVKGIVLGLVSAWATLTISKDVLTVLQLLEHIPLNKLTALFGGHAAGAAANAAGSAAASAAGSAATNAAGSAAAAASGFVPAIGAALPYAGLAAVTVGAGMALDKHSTQRNWGEYNKAQNELPQLMAQTADDKTKQMQSVLASFSHAMKEFEENDDPMTDRTESLKEAFRKDANQLLQDLPELNIWEMVKDKVNLSDGLDNAEIDKIINSLEFADQWLELGNQVVVGMADGIRDNQAEAEKAATDMANATIGATETALDSHSPSRVFEAIGENASVGLANGILARQDDVIAAAQAVAQAAEETLRSVLDIHSPSRVMMRLGAFTGEGFAQGVEDSISRVQASVSRMAGAAFRAPVAAQPQAAAYAQAAAAPIGASGAPGSVSAQQIQAVIMMDKKTVGYMVAPVVNEAIGAIVQEARV